MTATTPSLAIFERRLKEFLAMEACLNKWVHSPQVNVYCRKTSRFYNRKHVRCLDLATIEVPPRLRRRGIFKEVLHTMASVNPYEAVYIENACKHLQTYLDALPGCLPLNQTFDEQLFGRCYFLFKP